mmetsp:Transcript_1050/g.2521  ORF Transcript_1050/g.2521 Transcript_1050/m.2521 type:complete len:90 (+) Transcript_1050:146-415(+)
MRSIRRRKGGRDWRNRNWSSDGRGRRAGRVGQFSTKPESMISSSFCSSISFSGFLLTKTLLVLLSQFLEGFLDVESTVAASLPFLGRHS